MKCFPDWKPGSNGSQARTINPIDQAQVSLTCLLNSSWPVNSNLTVNQHTITMRCIWMPHPVIP